MTANLLDTHCHLDLYADPMALLDQARKASVDIVAVTQDPGKFRLLRTRLGRRQGVRLGIGLHPLRVTERYHLELDRLRRLVSQADWVGEVGLDFSKEGIATKKQQTGAFDALLALEEVRHRPMTVHSRRAEKDTISRLLQADVTAILHWYTGSMRDAEQAISGGLWFSINHAMIRSSRTASLLRTIPPQHILLETDGPFVRYGDRPVKPEDLPAIVKQLASVWRISREEATAQIEINQRRVIALMRPGPSGPPT